MLTYSCTCRDVYLRLCTQAASFREPFAFIGLATEFPDPSTASPLQEDEPCQLKEDFTEHVKQPRQLRASSRISLDGWMLS